MLNLRPPGGLAGAASRITGAMAKGVAAITMDEEYQQKRREAMNKQPSGLKEGLTRGGKGLVSVRTWVTLLVLEKSEEGFCIRGKYQSVCIKIHLLVFTSHSNSLDRRMKEVPFVM